MHQLVCHSIMVQKCTCSTYKHNESHGNLVKSQVSLLSNLDFQVSNHSYQTKFVSSGSGTGGGGAVAVAGLRRVAVSQRLQHADAVARLGDPGGRAGRRADAARAHLHGERTGGRTRLVLTWTRITSITVGCIKS